MFSFLKSKAKREREAEINRAAQVLENKIINFVLRQHMDGSVDRVAAARKAGEDTLEIFSHICAAIPAINGNRVLVQIFEGKPPFKMPAQANPNIQLIYSVIGGACLDTYLDHLLEKKAKGEEFPSADAFIKLVSGFSSGVAESLRTIWPSVDAERLQLSMIASLPNEREVPSE